MWESYCEDSCSKNHGFCNTLPSSNFVICIFNAFKCAPNSFSCVSGSWKPLMNSEILFFIFLLVAAFYLIWEIFFSSQLVWLKLQRCSAPWVGWGKVGLRLFRDRGCINLNWMTWNCLRYLSVCSYEGGSNYWCQLVSKMVCMWSMKQGGGSCIKTKHSRWSLLCFRMAGLGNTVKMEGLMVVPL